jgi:hypothetical protein
MMAHPQGVDAYVPSLVGCFPHTASCMEARKLFHSTAASNQATLQQFCLGRILNPNRRFLRSCVIPIAAARPPTLSMHERKAPSHGFDAQRQPQCRPTSFFFFFFFFFFCRLPKCSSYSSRRRFKIAGRCMVIDCSPVEKRTPRLRGDAAAAVQQPLPPDPSSSPYAAKVIEGFHQCRYADVGNDFFVCTG